MNKLILNFKSKESKKIKNPKNFWAKVRIYRNGPNGFTITTGFTISAKVCEIFYKDKKTQLEINQSD